MTTTNQPNTKLILRAYTILQQMTPDEHGLLNLLRSLSETEREQLIEIMSGNGPSSKKKAGKKGGGKSGGKSSRASGLEATLAKNLSRQRKCVVMVDDNGGEMSCGEVESNPIHDSSMGYAGYHEFDAGKSSAPRAGAKSSANGGATTSTPSLETEREGAGVAAGGSS